MFNSEKTEKPKTLTGQRLRSYAFALLTRRDYSQAELIAKLNQYAINPDEVAKLVEELAVNNYQSDQRVAEQTLASQIRKGKGLQRIKQALKAKQLDEELITEELKEVDWLEQAYQLKVKKFGTEVSKDQKIKAKQIRFLQYRGFDISVIMKAIARTSDEEYLVATLPARLRHIIDLLPLLPSGPGGVHRVQLRSYQQGYHCLTKYRDFYWSCKACLHF